MLARKESNSVQQNHSRAAVFPQELYVQQTNQGRYPPIISGMEPLERFRSHTVGQRSGHTIASSFNKPVRVTNPEVDKWNQLVQKMHGEEFKSRQFWSTRRRRQLHEISDRVFVASIIAGVVLSVLTSLWYRHFANVFNVYPVTIMNNRTSSQEYAEVKTSFITDIKDAGPAFSDYIMGLLLLLEGSFLANIARHRTFKWRSWCYLGAILILLASIAFIVAAPLLPLLATNSPTEIKKLTDNEYEAYKSNYRGTIKFFTKTQCNDIQKNVNEKDPSTAGKRMKFFCDMLSRLVCFLYFMWFTAAIPFVVFIFCWLEVIVNKRSWDMKTLHQCKPITLQQIADKSKSVSRNTKSQYDLENMFD